jgi:hypothetical protein
MGPRAARVAGHPAGVCVAAQHARQGADGALNERRDGAEGSGVVLVGAAVPVGIAAAAARPAHAGGVDVAGRGRVARGARQDVEGAAFEPGEGRGAHALVAGHEGLVHGQHPRQDGLARTPRRHPHRPLPRIGRREAVCIAPRGRGLAAFVGIGQRLEPGDVLGRTRGEALLLRPQRRLQRRPNLRRHTRRKLPRTRVVDGAEVELLGPRRPFQGRAGLDDEPRVDPREPRRHPREGLDEPPLDAAVFEGVEQPRHPRRPQRLTEERVVPRERRVGGLVPNEGAGLVGRNAGVVAADADAPHPVLEVPAVGRVVDLDGEAGVVGEGPPEGTEPVQGGGCLARRGRSGRRRSVGLRHGASCASQRVVGASRQGRRAVQHRRAEAQMATAPGS